MSARFLIIDEEGYFNLDGIRMADQETGQIWLSRMRIDDRGRPRIEIDGENCFVEAFDEPLIALDIEPSTESEWTARFPYGFTTKILSNSFRSDQWDRFHARTSAGVPVLLNRAAQSRLFERASEFDDESITISLGTRIIEVKKKSK